MVACQQVNIYAPAHRHIPTMHISMKIMQQRMVWNTQWTKWMHMCECDKSQYQTQERKNRIRKKENRNLLRLAKIYFVWFSFWKTLR